VKGAGHDIEIDAPDAVVSAIHRVLAQARNRQAAIPHR
jgi:hypothetical protein